MQAGAEDSLDQAISVTVQLTEGAEGFGWYAWETDCPEEGCFWFGDTRPTADDLRAMHPGYYVEAG